MPTNAYAAAMQRNQSQDEEGAGRPPMYNTLPIMQPNPNFGAGANWAPGSVPPPSYSSMPAGGGPLPGAVATPGPQYQLASQPPTNPYAAAMRNQQQGDEESPSRGPMAPPAGGTFNTLPVMMPNPNYGAGGQFPTASQAPQSRTPMPAGGPNASTAPYAAAMQSRAGSSDEEQPQRPMTPSSPPPPAASVSAAPAGAFPSAAQSGTAPQASQPMGGQPSLGAQPSTPLGGDYYANQMRILQGQGMFNPLQGGMFSGDQTGTMQAGANGSMINPPDAQSMGGNTPTYQGGGPLAGMFGNTSLSQQPTSAPYAAAQNQQTPQYLSGGDFSTRAPTMTPWRQQQPAQPQPLWNNGSKPPSPNKGTPIAY